MILPELVSHGLIVVALFLATLTDFDKREVPDYLNYGMLSIGLGGSVIVSVLQMSFWPVISSIAGIVLGYIVGAFMFYTGQWGGGDAKMLMAMGAILGVGLDTWMQGLFIGEFPFFVTVIITIFLAGAVYGLGFSFFLVFKHWKTFKKGFLEKIRTPQLIFARKIVLVVCVLSIILLIFIHIPIIRALALIIGFGSFFGLYAFAFAKTIEEVCMIKTIAIEDLTEGEWILKDIIVDGTYICGPKDLGISNEQIQQLKQSDIKNVTIKIGIPFIPGFLLGYIVVLVWGNWILQYIPYIF